MRAFARAGTLLGLLLSGLLLQASRAFVGHFLNDYRDRMAKEYRAMQVALDGFGDPGGELMLLR